jgi:hypothetical protein
MELSVTEQHEVWGKIVEIPTGLQPTVFVIQPGPRVPTLTHFKLIKDPDPIQDATFFLYLFHFSPADVARNIPLAVHISRVIIKPMGEIEWNAYKTNLFVIGWEKQELKEQWKKFIINYLENKDV